MIVVLNAPGSFEPELRSLKGISVRRDLSAARTSFALAFVTKQKDVDSIAQTFTAAQPAFRQAGQGGHRR